MASDIEVAPASGAFARRQRQLVEHLKDPLYRDGYALMSNTAITSLLGLIYWFVATKAYDAAVVGRNWAQISAMLLLSALTQCNFTSVLVRFAPRAGRQTHRLIVSAYAVAAVFAAASTALVLAVAHVITSPHAVLHVSLLFGLWFTVATAAWSVFNLQDAALTSLRKALVIPVENGVFGIVKIGLLFAFSSLFGAAGVFMSWTVPVLVILVPVNYLIFRRFVPAHAAATQATEQPLDWRRIRGFIAGDYVGSLFAQATLTLMPVVVASVLGDAPTAYFSVAQTMSLAVDLVSFNLANSLTVAAAGQEERTAELARAVARKMLTLVLPAVAVLMLLAPALLSILGQEGEDYAAHATTLLRLLALASIPKIATSIHGVLARVQHKTHRNAFFAGIQAVLLVGLSIVLMNTMGLVGVGVAALVSQTTVGLLTLPWVLRNLRTPPPHRATAHHAR